MPVIRSEFALGMIVGASVLSAGLLLGGAGREGPSPSAPPQTIRARQFEVVDARGEPRLIIGANDRGGTISVRDNTGKTILLAGAAEHGGMIVVTDARSAQPALMAGAASTGGAVQLFDVAGKQVLDAIAGPRGGELSIAGRGDAVDTTALRLETGEQGAGKLTGYTSAGGRVFNLGADDADRGVIGTYAGRANEALVSLSATAAGQGQIRTAAGNGAPLVVLTASADDEGQIYTFNAEGGPLAAIGTRALGPTLRIFNAQGAPVVTLEADAEGQGSVGVWRPDGSGRTVRP